MGAAGNSLMKFKVKGIPQGVVLAREENGGNDGSEDVKFAHGRIDSIDSIGPIDSIAGSDQPGISYQYVKNYATDGKKVTGI
jgi:hypothetical protein